MSRMMRVVILMMMIRMIRTRSHLNYEHGDHKDRDVGGDVGDGDDDESGLYDHGSRMMNQGGCSSWGRDFKMVLNRSF